jgi:hypothetical protein
MKTFMKHFNLISTIMLILFAVLVGIGFIAVPETAAVALPLIGLTTLAADAARSYELGDLNDIPVIASDIIYEGAAVGAVKGTGHARPLAAGDKFAGFAETKADNSAGAAAAINVRVRKRGQVQLSVSGAVITDINQPVYATDDATFVFLPTGGVFIGFVKRFVSAGVAVVEFDADNFQDPYGVNKVYETLSAATKTLDAQDTGKVIFVTVTSVITLPVTATALADVTLVCMAPYGTAQISADPAAADKIMGPDLAGVDNKDLINTLATAQRGDYVTLTAGHADGYVVNRLKGTWAAEA